MGTGRGRARTAYNVTGVPKNYLVDSRTRETS